MPNIKHFILAVGLSLFGAASAVAAPHTSNSPAARRPHGGKHGKIKKLVLKEFDTNRDGRIDRTERAAIKARYDVDRDGKLSKPERRKMRRELKSRR